MRVKRRLTRKQKKLAANLPKESGDGLDEIIKTLEAWGKRPYTHVITPNDSIKQFTVKRRRRWFRRK